MHRSHRRRARASCASTGSTGRSSLARNAAASKAAAEWTRKQAAKRIIAVNQKLESLPGAPQERLKATIAWARRELGIKSQDRITAYVYAAHGEGTMAHYHGLVKHSAGPAGRALTERMFAYKPIKAKVFELFKRHQGDPESMPLPHEVAEKHGFDVKKVYNAYRAASSHPDHAATYKAYLKKANRIQVARSMKRGIENRSKRAVIGMSNVVALHELSVPDMPGASQSAIARAVSAAAGRNTSAAMRMLRAAGGKGGQRYDKYTGVFQERGDSPTVKLLRRFHAEIPDPDMALRYARLMQHGERDAARYELKDEGILKPDGDELARKAKSLNSWASQLRETHPQLLVPEHWADALKAVGFVAYNMMHEDEGKARAQAMGLIRTKLASLGYVPALEMKQVAEFIFKKEREDWLKGRGA